MSLNHLDRPRNRGGDRVQPTAPKVECRGTLSVAEILELGYVAARLLPDGRWLAIQPLMYTAGLMVEVGRLSYAYRYCYPNLVHALIAMETWDGTGDPPGPWVKQKGRGVERLNPRLADDNFED
jgi:hypothetical protein